MEVRKKLKYFIILFVSIMLISGSGTNHIVHSMNAETAPEVKIVEEEGAESTLVQNPIGSTTMEKSSAEVEDTANVDLETENKTVDPLLESLADKTGFLLMGMVNNTPFNPGNSGNEEVDVIFKPRKEGNKSRTLVIAGFKNAGLNVEKPNIKSPIASTSISADRDKLIVEFERNFNVGSDVSFRFSIKVSDEKKFIDALQRNEGNLPCINGLVITEYVDEVPDQSVTSNMQVNYVMTESDLLIKESNSNFPNLSYGAGMALYTNAKNVDGDNVDSRGWQMKEGEYYLRPLVQEYISPRYIENMRIEIPLPPNVTYVGSDYETEKNGLKISGSTNKTHVILECKEYNPNFEIKFTMTLDFTHVSNEGGVDDYGVNNWHDFWSKLPSILSRKQTDTPWKFSGEIYGVKQTKQFYDRSILVLDTAIEYPFQGLHGDFKYSTKKTNLAIGSEISENPDIDSLQIFSTNLAKFNHDYTRKGTFEIDQAIRIKTVKFNSDNGLDGSIAFTFHTNKGNTVTKYKLNGTSSEVITTPPVSEGEYINKVTVEATGNRSGKFRFIADVLDVDINGIALPTGTKSEIKMYWDIPNYGPIRTKSQYVEKAAVTFVEQNVAAPIVNRNVINTNKPGGNGFRLIKNFSYKDVNLLLIKNTEPEIGNIVNRDLIDIKIDEANTIIKDVKGDSESIPVYQMMTKETSTLQLKNYKESNLPNVKIIYTTSLGNTGETRIDKSKFVLSNGNASTKVKFTLPDGEVIQTLGLEISSLPSGAELNLTLDEFNVNKDTLPSGRSLDTLPKSSVSNTTAANVGGYPATNTMITEWQFERYNLKYKSNSGAEIHMSVPGHTAMEFMWNFGTNFSWILADYLNSTTQNPAIFPGDKTTVKLALSDTAFNPTYGIEIDKNFNYVPGSLKVKNGSKSGTHEYKFIEEWIPNYFNDPERKGNGLLRIRFIGSGSNAFNLFPMETFEFYYLYFKGEARQLQFDLYAKNDAEKSTHKMIKKMYRSDQWAMKNLMDKQLAVSSWNGSQSLPEISNYKSPIRLLNGIQGQSPEIPPMPKPNSEIDYYDIDGDGDKTHYILAGDVRSSVAEMQQIAQLGSTDVKTYLVDKKTGVELRDAKLLPHQEVGFVQTLQLLSTSGDGSDFIGYYHIPKKGHVIEYVDKNGTSQKKTSEFDTYITDFITTKSEDGSSIPEDKKLSVYYFISPDPTDLTDGHNDMNELGGGTDITKYYKTEDEVKQLAKEQNKTVKEILENCTMVKIKADVVEVNKKIISKTTLAMGHKEAGDKNPITGYFSGKYKFTNNGAVLPVSYTPLVTFTMNPYVISGTIFYDKDANSLMSPLESRKAGVDVELWQTGKDPHTGAPLEEKVIDRQITDISGAYLFTKEYHGDFFLKFKIPDGQTLSLKDKQEGYLDERSTFEVDKDDATIAKYSFTLNDANLPFQNAGLVDKRDMLSPEHIYISVGEQREIPYQITPDYLMNEDDYKFLPSVYSDATNDPFFTIDEANMSIKGLSEGVKTITVSIPDAPLGGAPTITKNITVHVEPASVASVSVPTKAEVYAIKGKDNEVIAPQMVMYSYGLHSVNAYIRNIELQNTGSTKDLVLVKEKADSTAYANDEISLRVTPVQKNNPFSRVVPTDITQVEYQNGGLLLGTLPNFENRVDGLFTFDGKYNPNIELSDIENNRFIMKYRFEKVTTP